MELVRSGGVADGEAGAEISLKVLNFLDVLQQSCIDCLLDGLKLGLEGSCCLLALFGFLESVL